MAEKSMRQYFTEGLKEITGIGKTKSATPATAPPAPATPTNPVGNGAIPKRNAAIKEAAEDTAPDKPMGVKGSYAPRGN